MIYFLWKIFLVLYSLEFGDYHFDSPRYTIKEGKERETTFASPLKVDVRLFNRETGEVKEQEIFMGDMPTMTDSGTFYQWCGACYCITISP